MANSDISPLVGGKNSSESVKMGYITWKLSNLCVEPEVFIDSIVEVGELPWFKDKARLYSRAPVTRMALIYPIFAPVRL
jgi:hypothetical protein